MTAITDAALVWRAATTSENYNWVKRISDALTAAGLPLHTDTGQVNLVGTTLTIPATPDETFKQAGFQIRKLESAGLPTIYIRFDYGVRRYSQAPATATSNCPSLRVSYGLATDGAGNLTLGLMQMEGGIPKRLVSDWGYYIYGAISPPNSQRSLFVSSDGGNFLTMLIDPNLNTNDPSRANAHPPLVIAIERTISPLTGEYDGDGIAAINAVGIAMNGETNAYFHVGNLEMATAFTAPSAVPYQSVRDMFVSSGQPGETNLFPITVCLPKAKGPMRSAMGYYRADISAGYQFSSEIYGVEHNYITCGNQIQASSADTYLSLALRFE